jgi:hypothetical protein
MHNGAGVALDEGVLEEGLEKEVAIGIMAEGLESSTWDQP